MNNIQNIKWGHNDNILVSIQEHKLSFPRTKFALRENSYVSDITLDTRIHTVKENLEGLKAEFEKLARNCGVRFTYHEI